MQAVFEFTTHPETYTTYVYLRPTVDGVLLDDVSLERVTAAEPER